MQNADTLFSAFCPETEEKNELAKKKFDLTRNFQKVVRAPAFSGREKIGNSYYFKILGIV